MPDMEATIILQIQNSRKLEELISVIVSDSDAHFETRGLEELFGLDEIWIERSEFLQSMEEYAVLLSYLLETMSAAKDFNLPYNYVDDFEYRGRRYSLAKENEHRILKKEDQ